VRADGNAAPIIGDGKITIRVQFNFYAGGVSCDGFVHRVVDNFGKEMMQSAVICTANIHARAQADRLEAFKDFNVFG